MVKDNPDFSAFIPKIKLEMPSMDGILKHSSSIINEVKMKKFIILTYGSVQKGGSLSSKSVSCQRIGKYLKSDCCLPLVFGMYLFNGFLGVICTPKHQHIITAKSSDLNSKAKTMLKMAPKSAHRSDMHFKNRSYGKSK
jgi:hypothetical protein